MEKKKGQINESINIAQLTINKINMAKLTNE
jgi:hypothetical protein